ncbi:MAG: glycosyltransferase [Clostridium sp.]|nr:glycosyltransferase [Clostridium sp.]
MISVCIISKDEEKNIEICLESLVKYDYEIIVVDTGSKDRTKDIAHKFTEKVYDFKWCDDFSAARNFAISKASNEFVLTIDSDEVVESIDEKEINKLLLSNRKKVGRILIKSLVNKKGTNQVIKDKVGRIFSKYEYKYEGSIHEQLVPLSGDEVRNFMAPIIVNHSGYTIEEIARKDKVNRNIKILKNELEQRENDSYILYQLGKSYYMDEDYNEAYKYFGETLDLDLDVRLDYVKDLVECYGYTMLNLKKYDEALNLFNIYNEFSTSSDFVFLCGLIYMNNGLFGEAIKEFEKATNMNNEKVVGINSYLSYYNIGIINECLGNVKDARKYYLKCDNYAPAKKRVELLK